MDKVNRREFLHHTEKYLKLGSFILTKHGKEEYVVTIALPKRDEQQSVADIFGSYGCGCKKVTGHLTCPTHFGRI